MRQRKDEEERTTFAGNPSNSTPVPRFVLEMDHIRWHELACHLSMAFSAYNETVIKEIEIQQLRRASIILFFTKISVRF